MVSLDLPVRGEWRVIRSPGHERFAFDLVAIDEAGRRRRSSVWTHLYGRAMASDFMSWDRAVLAPCDGSVTATENQRPDREQIRPFQDLFSVLFRRRRFQPADLSEFTGNCVLLQHQAPVYILLAHLRRGSVQVRARAPVTRGQEIGRVGNSGVTLEPHLHVQVFDTPEIARAKTVPFVIREFEIAVGRTWATRRNEPLRKGIRIRPAET